MQYLNAQIKTALYAPWESGRTYYVKCKDSYGNQPDPNECSIIASPRSLSGEPSADLRVGGSASFSGSSSSSSSGTTNTNTTVSTNKTATNSTK